MHHAKHTELIRQLEDRVLAGPPPGGFSSAYFQSCWALVKRIGPAFKASDYPRPQDRQLAWKRFDKALTRLKTQQETWEKAAETTEQRISALLDAAQPQRVTMADLLAPKAATPQPASPKKQQEALHACTERHKAALAEFMAAKKELSHEQFKRLSQKLRDVKKGIGDAWDAFKAAHPIDEQSRAKRNKAWAVKQEAFVEEARERLRSDLALLDTKRAANLNFSTQLAAAEDDADRQKLKRWIADNDDVISQLEADIRHLKATLAQAEASLDRA